MREAVTGKKDLPKPSSGDQRRMGVVGIIVTDRFENAPKVNEVLTAYGSIIVGRMGIPYRERHISVMALIVDGTTDELGAMAGKLGSIPGVRVKTALTA